LTHVPGWSSPTSPNVLSTVRAPSPNFGPKNSSEVLIPVINPLPPGFEKFAQVQQFPPKGPIDRWQRIKPRSVSVDFSRPARFLVALSPLFLLPVVREIPNPDLLIRSLYCMELIFDGEHTPFPPFLVAAVKTFQFFPGSDSSRYIYDRRMDPFCSTLFGAHVSLRNKFSPFCHMGITEREDLKVSISTCHTARRVGALLTCRCWPGLPRLGPAGPIVSFTPFCLDGRCLLLSAAPATALCAKVAPLLVEIFPGLPLRFFSPCNRP